MITALGLLIAPSCQYIITERGQSTRRMVEEITWETSLAQFPYAMALGLDVTIGIEQIFGTPIGIVAGIAFTVITPFLWYGIEEIARHTKGEKERLKADQTP